MNQRKAEALKAWFVQRMVSEAGAEVAQSISMQLNTPDSDMGATITGVFFSDRKDALESVDFVSKASRQPLDVCNLLPLSPHTQEHRFVEDAGGVIKDGKSSYPDFLRVYIKRSDAFTFAMNILRQLEYPRPDADSLLEIPIFGLLERVSDDDV